jgi:TatD DNase family protein
MYQGEYHGKPRHPSDLEAVVKRAHAAGVERILITGTSLSESKAALDLAKKYSEY